MPHVIIEHSFPISDSKLSELFLLLNQNIAKNEGNYDINQCKARSVFCKNFLLSDGQLGQELLHITIKIINSRSIELRKNLAENLLKVVVDFLNQNKLASNPIALSLDIREIEKEIYQKTVVQSS